MTENVNGLIQQNVDKRASQSVTSVSFQNLEAPVGEQVSLRSLFEGHKGLACSTLNQSRRDGALSLLAGGSSASFAPPRVFFYFNRWGAI